MNTSATVELIVPAGCGPRIQQTSLLIESIREYAPDLPTYICLPDAEWGNVPREVREHWDTAGTLLKSKIPLSEYPVSAKIGALRKVERDRDINGRTRVLLDTDTVLLDRLPDQIIAPDTEVAAKPEDTDREFWSSTESESEWRDLYSSFNLQWPGYTHRSSTEGRPIPPYYNSGVVVTKTELADRWLELTQSVLEEFPGEFFSDQLGLALLMRSHVTESLPETMNYPGHIEWRPPRNTTILHYHTNDALERVLDPFLRRRLRRLSSSPIESDYPTLSQLFSAARTTVGSVRRIYLNPYLGEPAKMSNAK